MNEQALKEVIENLATNIDMTDLELYRICFKDVISVFDLFFENYLRRKEGYSCSADKSGFIARRVHKHLYSGENQSLQETYREYQQRGGNIESISDEKLDELAYWCPKTIKDTNEALSIIFHYLCMDSKFFKDKITEGNVNE